MPLITSRVSPCLKVVSLLALPLVVYTTNRVSEFVSVAPLLETTLPMTPEVKPRICCPTNAEISYFLYTIFPAPSFTATSETEDNLTKSNLLLSPTSPGITSSPCLKEYLPKLSIWF